ncbi:MAG: ATP-binding protein [Deltaproteobacteria bacterium]|nr:ATP-binding protein [Deltaproteobacteria bacterium]MBW1952024.1 ATP-binding protein [Deltaproteobacteria bacterium]MBW1986088.1 ATP-binding protein [Deltaproteobacteria bacterium]MBW2134226.1 ATP-binding protein [Deltaproteobacteria bacterium]
MIFGLIATGKTTLAQTLGREQGWPVIHSDAVRKTLAGLAPSTRVAEDFGKGIYSAEFSRRTYEEMLRQARQYLEAGAPVILDGSFKRSQDRRAVRKLAQDLGVHLAFIYCTCNPTEVQHRLAQRRENLQAISNGRPEILAAQQQDFDILDDLKGWPLLELDTGRPPETVLREVEEFLESLTHAKGGCDGTGGNYCPS